MTFEDAKLLSKDDRILRYFALLKRWYPVYFKGTYSKDESGKTEKGIFYSIDKGYPFDHEFIFIYRDSIMNNFKLFPSKVLLLNDAKARSKAV